MKTILGNFVFINEENRSKEIQGKNVLSFTKFVLGSFCPGFFWLGVFCPGGCRGVYVRGVLSGGFRPDTELTQHFSQSKSCKIDNVLRVYILQDNLEDGVFRRSLDHTPRQ